VLLQPLDVLKTRLQQYYGSGAGVTNPGNLSKSLINGSISPSQAPAARALSEFRVWSALRTIYHADGVLSLWRGVAPSLARVGLGSGTYFVALSELQHVAAEHRGDGSAIHALNFATGAAARVIASTVVAPITVLKTRLEAADSLHRSGYDITRQMLHQHPLRSSFKGFIPTLCRDAPYSGLYVTIYAHIRSAMSDLLPSTSSPILINFSSGAFAGLIATMVTQVRRRTLLRHHCDGVMPFPLRKHFPPR
jgi:solute carrier family 25 protein 38